MRLCLWGRGRAGGGGGSTVFTSKLSHVFDITHDITLGCQHGGVQGDRMRIKRPINFPIKELLKVKMSTNYFILLLKVYLVFLSSGLNENLLSGLFTSLKEYSYANILYILSMLEIIIQTLINVVQGGLNLNK